MIPAKHQLIGMRPLTGPTEKLYSKSTNASAIFEDVSVDAFDGVKSKVESEMPSILPSPGDDVSIACLGTGSAMPAKYRNGEQLDNTFPPFIDRRNSQRHCGTDTWVG